MKINKVTTVFFSPTDLTKKVLMLMAKEFPLKTEEIDIADYAKKDATYQFTQDELVIIGAPVYGGRAPSPAIQRLEKMRGNNTPAVVVAVFGNRNYDDSLLELQNTVEKNGFKVIAAAAVVAEHSIMKSIAVGRPDDEDAQNIKDFTVKVQQKLAYTEDISALSKLKVNGNENYIEYKGVPFKPLTTDACEGCGLCAEKCPVGAIPKDHPNQTQTEICISCMRCIEICPNKARHLDAAMLAHVEKSFREKCGNRKEAEFFI